MFHWVVNEIMVRKQLSQTCNLGLTSYLPCEVKTTLNLGDNVGIPINGHRTIQYSSDMS